MKTKEPKVLFTDCTFLELHDRLFGLNVEVPPLPKKRDDTPEIYSIVRLFGTVPFEMSDFPLQLTKFDRPDFTLQLAGRSVGIEHTQAMSQNAVHEAIIRASQGGSGVHFVRPATVGEPRKSRKELQKEIDENRMPPPMMGDSVERNWADAMTHCISTKLASAREPGYRVHDRYWLAIYDNWPAPALKRELALALLQERLPAIEPFAVFEKVYILTGKMLVEFARGSLQLRRLQDYASASRPESTRVRLAITPGGRCSVLRFRRSCRQVRGTA